MMSIDRCHYITRVKPKQNSIQNLFETVKSIESRVQNGVYEFPWLFKVRSSVIYIEDSDPEDRLRAAFCSMIREQDKMVPNHFIENYHSCVINDKMIGDPYHPDLTEFKYFKEKPLNFLVIGKPGLNTETVAYRLAEIWKSILISPTIAVKSVLPYTLDNKSKTKLKENSLQLSLDQILEAVNLMRTSAESKRQGYVLTGLPLPSYSSNTFNIEKQLEFIFKNITRPNIIIYLTSPNTDVLLLNENGFFRNIHNNNLYFKRHLDDGEVVRDELYPQTVNFENNGYYLLKEYHNFMEEEKTKFFVVESNTSLNADILGNYVAMIFPLLDRYLLQYDSQCVFKVDGRNTTVEIIETIQDKLRILCLIPLCDPSPVFDVHIDDGVVTKPDSLSFNSVLSSEEIKFEIVRKTIESQDYESEEEEETSKDDDDDEVESEKDEVNSSNVLVLDSYKNLEKREAFEVLKKHCTSNQGFNLVVSDYNILCPVEMHRGYICEGEIDFACKYAGKLFLLSSMDAVRKFLKDPARYALSPPLSTRKIAVIGPPMTGKSTVAYYLSGFFGIKVISIRRLIEKVYSVSMRKMEGNIFEMFGKTLRKLESSENEKQRQSEELRALEILNWIKEQIPVIIERLKYSSFIVSNQIRTSEDLTEIISKQPLILPNPSLFLESIDNLKKDIKSMTNFEVSFGGKFTQLYKNPQPVLKESYSLTEADNSMSKLRDYFSSRGFDFFDDIIKCREFLADPLKLAAYLPSNLRQPNEKVREINYEDVLKSVVVFDGNGINTPFGFLRMNVQNLADALEEEILETEAENNVESGFESDLKMGGWILDGLPIDDGLWSEMVKRFLLPDDLICKIVDVSGLDAVKDQFLKVEPYTKLKDCYDELVKSSRSIRGSDFNGISLQDSEKCTGKKNLSSSYNKREKEHFEKFLVPDGSMTLFTTTRCKNPFNNEDHEICYLRANFWCDRSFLSDYFEQSVTKYLKSAKSEKVSILGNLHRIQNKDSLESLKLSFAADPIISRSTITNTLDSFLVIEDLRNCQNSMNYTVSMIEDDLNQNSMMMNSNSINILNSRVSENKIPCYKRKLSTDSEEWLQRKIQGYFSELHEKHWDNWNSEEYLNWFNHKEVSLTKEMIWTPEEHCSKSNSDLSSSIVSDEQCEEDRKIESVSTPEKEASMKSICSDNCLQFIREVNNYINNDMSMIALHSMVISELNIFKSSLDAWLVEPFDVSAEFLTKYKTLYPEQFKDERKVVEQQCRTKSELEFYRKTFTEKMNLINAIEALMKQDEQFDKVVDYLQKYARRNENRRDSERCFSTTLCSMIPKREKEVTSLPNVIDSKHQIRSLDGSRLSADTLSYNEIDFASDTTLSVFEWYVVSDDVLLFSRQSSDFMMIDGEKPSEIHVKRTSKDMELPKMSLKPVSHSLKQDSSSSKNSPIRREERPCIWKDCVETKVCHKQTTVQKCESVNKICKNVVQEVVNSVTTVKEAGKFHKNDSVCSKKDSKTGEKASYKTNDKASFSKYDVKTVECSNSFGSKTDSKSDKKSSTSRDDVKTIKYGSVGSKTDSKCDKTGEESSCKTLNSSGNSNKKFSTSRDDLKTIKYGSVGSKTDSKFDKIGKKASYQTLNSLEISNDRSSTREKSVKTTDSNVSKNSSKYEKNGKDIEDSSQTLNLSDKSNGKNFSSNFTHSDQEIPSENSSNKASTSKNVYANGDCLSEYSNNKATCSKYTHGNTECPYMQLTPFENPKNECLLPNVSADNWLRFLSFISNIYSNIGQFEGRSSKECDDRLSKLDRKSCGDGDENSLLLQKCDCNSLRDSEGSRPNREEYCMKSGVTIVQKDDDRNSLGDSNIETDSSLLDLTILSKLEINLPIPQDQFETCLDIALRCLTEGKTIEELYSCHPHLCSGSAHFTSGSLESLFGQENFKQLHICHSHGNESVRYQELPDGRSDTKSNSSETVEVLLKPSLIYSVEGVGLTEKNFETSSSQYTDTDFLKSAPRAILHLIEIENDNKEVSGDKLVEFEDVVKYCYLIKNYKHLKQFDINAGEFYTRLKELERIKDENSQVITMENYISSLMNPDAEYYSNTEEICSFLSELSAYSTLKSSTMSGSILSEMDLENLISSNNNLLPSKLSLFSNNITASIRAWLEDWSNFKANFLCNLNRCNVIEHYFIAESKDYFPDSLVSKLLSSYDSKTVKIEPAKEKLIKTLSRDQSEHTMNDFIENISPVNKSDLKEEKTKYENDEHSHSTSDIFPYCPVTYKEEGKLFIAGSEFTATFKGETYNFATKIDREKFLDNPENYAIQPMSDYRVPPLRICILSNLFFDEEKRLTRQVADYFNLQSVSFYRKIKRLLLQNTSKQLGLINEDTINMEMFDLGETMFDQDNDACVKKVNYIRDYLNFKSALSENDLKILVDHLFCSPIGSVMYGFPHIVDDLSFIVKEKITPNVIVYIDVEDERKRKIEFLERKIRDRQLLNYGSRLRKMMQLDRLKYILWSGCRKKLFNIVLRQLLKQRRDNKFATKRFNQLFSHKATTENLESSGENSTKPDNNDLVVENNLNRMNNNVEKVDSEEGLLIKKSPKAGNVLYSRQIDAKNRNEFRAYLLEKKKEQADEVEIFNCESQADVSKFNERGDNNFQIFKPIQRSKPTETNQINPASSLQLLDLNNENNSLDGESLEDLDDRKKVAFMDLRHLSKEQDRYLPKFESVHYLPADYDVKKEYYMESAPSKGSSEWMGMDPTDSICSREITSSINLHPNLPSSKKTRKIALQYGVHKISEEFLINAYDIFRKKFPPPKSSAKNLKPFNYSENNNDSLNVYHLNETKNINAMKELCSKYNIPFIKHTTTSSLKKLLESIKCITRWPDVFEKCHIITHKIASDLLNSGHYFFSKFGRWCPVAIFEKQLPILQNYPAERMEKLVHPVIHKKYIYFIHTKTSLMKFVSSPLKYIEQDPYLSVFPIKIAVVGCPKSGKTKIIEYLRNLYGLHVVRADTAVEYVCKKQHWTELAQNIHACLKQGNLLSSQLIVKSLEAYLLSPKFVNRGWILDGFPVTQDDVQFMKKFDIIPQVTVCVETNTVWENCVSNKLHEERMHLENFNDGLVFRGRLKNDYDDNVMFKKNHEEDDSESLFHQYLPPINFFKYRILKWRQNKTIHADLKTAMHDSWGNILEISWKKNHLKMVARMLEFIKTCLLAFQNYTTNMQQNLPASMFCLNLSKSEFEMHMSVFKEVCPCCWYYSKIYHRCPTMNFRDMTTGLFQYGNYIYWICTEHTDMFLYNPTVFLNHDVEVFKETYPVRLSPLIGEKTIQLYFDLQFQGKCITCYVKNLPNIVLKNGLKTYALALKKKLIYLFCQESCLLSMLIKPQDFSYVKLPQKLKNPKVSPVKAPPSSTVCTKPIIIVTDYFEHANIYEVLCNALMRVSKVRPRIFEIDNEISSGTYLALILKAHANKSKIFILNEILASFETYSHMIQISCSFIDRLACGLNVCNLADNEGSEMHTQYFFNRLIPLLTSSKDGKSIRD